MREADVFAAQWAILAGSGYCQYPTHHVINPSRPSPCLLYCKRQKLGMEAWERGYIIASQIIEIKEPAIYVFFHHKECQCACLGSCMEGTKLAKCIG